MAMGVPALYHKFSVSINTSFGDIYHSGEHVNVYIQKIRSKDNLTRVLGVR